MSLYKYVSIDTLKKILNGSIRFTQPGAFNDPFEMLPELHVPQSFSDDKIAIQFDLLSERRLQGDGSLADGFESDFCNDFNSRDILYALNESIGVLCLSKVRDSLLTWSHYADQYAGAVVEFDDSHEFFDGKIEVEYRSMRPKKDITAYISDGNPVPIAELCTKPEDWQYEQEVRLVRSLSECRRASNDSKFPVYVMPLPAECIKSITLGERASVEHQREIWKAVKDSKIALSLAAISNYGYGFRNELIKLEDPCSKSSPFLSPRTAHIFVDDDGDFGQMARWMLEEHPASHLVNKIL